MLLRFLDGEFVGNCALNVIANNERAIALYKKMGFEICGTTPNGSKYKDGTYADEHIMVRML